jgi:hypothetical protein
MRYDSRHNLRTTKHRTRKADKGHSVVLRESWTRSPVLGMAERRAITCQCGKRWTGNGIRADYSYADHLRKEGVRA